MKVLEVFSRVPQGPPGGRSRKKQMRVPTFFFCEELLVCADSKIRIRSDLLWIAFARHPRQAGTCWGIRSKTHRRTARAPGARVCLGR